MACENLSNHYPIVMKFSGNLVLKDTSAIFFLELPPTPMRSQRCDRADCQQIADKALYR